MLNHRFIERLERVKSELQYSNHYCSCIVKVRRVSHSLFKIHRSCIKIFPLTVTVESHPRGSNKREMLDNIDRLITALIADSKLTIFKANSSLDGVHCVPRVFTEKSSPKFLGPSSQFFELEGINWESFTAHLSNSIPPDFKIDTYKLNLFNKAVGRSFDPENSCNSRFWNGKYPIAKYWWHPIIHLQGIFSNHRFIYILMLIIVRNKVSRQPVFLLKFLEWIVHKNLYDLIETRFLLDFFSNLV